MKKYEAMVLSCIDPRFQTKVYKYLKNKKDTTCLILPGSRESEIKYNLDTLLKTVLKINCYYKNKITWLLPTLDRFQEIIQNKIIVSHYCLNFFYCDRLNYIQNFRINISYTY